MALQLSSHTFRNVVLPAVPPGSANVHLHFQISAGGAPFSILGFQINAYTAAGGPAGHVTIDFSRINGVGISAPTFTLANGNTYQPQDLVMSYGSVLSAANSLTFHLTQTAAACGTGVEVKVEGSLTYLADSAAALSVEVVTE